jgi:hypothetical protein
MLREFGEENLKKPRIDALCADGTVLKQISVEQRNTFRGSIITGKFVIS